ncbi:hypothetical protein Tco_1332409, partial [Tanacetum coccineum]
ESKEKEDKYLDEIIDLQKQKKALDNVVYKIEQAFWLPISKPVSKIPPAPLEPVIKKEIPRELPTISLVKDSFNKIRDHVNNFDEIIIVHTKVIGYNQGACGFEYIQRAFEKDVTPFANTLKEYFQMFDYGLEKELKDMQAIFNQMETKDAKCSVDKKYFEIEKKQLIIENERLLEHIICQDVMNVVMHADVESKNVLPANNNCLDNDNIATELLKIEMIV